MSQSNPTKRLFLILWAAGMAGVLSLLLLDLEALIAILPTEYAAENEVPPWLVLKLASVMQPAILVTVVVAIGIWLASKVGLRAPASEAFADRRAILPELQPQIVPGIIAGVLSGVAIVASWLLFRPYLEPEFVARSTFPLALFVITANSIFGYVAGFLYWRFGLESAMVAHIFAHVVLLSAVYLAL